MPEEEEGEGSCVSTRGVVEPMESKASATSLDLTSLLALLCNAVNNDNIICTNVANVLQCSHKIRTLFYMPYIY